MPTSEETKSANTKDGDVDIRPERFTPKNIVTSDDRANMVYAIKIAVPNDGYLKIGMYGGIKL